MFLVGINFYLRICERQKSRRALIVAAPLYRALARGAVVRARGGACAATD